jgi:hypothetical protein
MSNPSAMPFQIELAEATKSTRVTILTRRSFGLRSGGPTEGRAPPEISAEYIPDLTRRWHHAGVVTVVAASLEVAQLQRGNLNEGPRLPVSAAQLAREIRFRVSMNLKPRSIRAVLRICAAAVGICARQAPSTPAAGGGKVPGRGAPSGEPGPGRARGRA